MRFFVCFFLVGLLIVPDLAQANKFWIFGGDKKDNNQKGSKVYVAPVETQGKQSNVFSLPGLFNRPPSYRLSQQLGFEIPRGFDLSLIQSAGREPGSIDELKVIAKIKKSGQMRKLAEKRLENKRKMAAFLAEQNKYQNAMPVQLNRPAAGQGSGTAPVQQNSKPDRPFIFLKPEKVFKNF